MTKFTKLFSSFGLFFFLSSSYLFASEVDLLVVYDNYTKSRFSGSPETAVKNWVDQSNNFYKSSQVDISVRLVGILNYEIQGKTMNDVLESARVDQWIAEKRDELGADFVTVLHETGNCGLGYMAVDAAWAFNVVGADCGNATTLAHELGHNMGLNHSRLQGDTGGYLYKYALGHGVNNSFGTLMTYEWLFNAKSAAVFSNPNIKCSGHPCGVPEGEAEQADAAKALNNVKERISKFRPTRVASDDDSSGGSSNDDGSNDNGSNDDGSNNDNSTDQTGSNLAPSATASMYADDSSAKLAAVNDDQIPSSSSDNSHGYFLNSIPARGYQGVQYIWDQEVTINSSEVYWFDDGDKVKVPAFAYFFYLADNEWKENGTFTLNKNQFNKLAQKNIQTRGVYILFSSAEKSSSGILEWRVNGSK